MNEIEVKITANRSRKYFIMYYHDPVTDVREQRSTKRTKRRDADRVAAQWEAEFAIWEVQQGGPQDDVGTIPGNVLRGKADGVAVQDA